MEASVVNAYIVEQINQGNERAFEALYNSYFVYLCACSNSYIFDTIESQDIVNEVFAKVWYNRGYLSFPIHSYLVQAVKNGCLNYLRSLHSRNRIIDEYREELLTYQEEYCISDENPLLMLEMDELQFQLRQQIASLPEKCRFVFEQYLYSCLTPEEIAVKNHLAISTVRVHIKHAMDKLKEFLGPQFGLLIFFLFEK